MRLTHTRLVAQIRIGAFCLAGAHAWGEATMGLLFQDNLFDQFGGWPIAYIPYGGADFGEIVAVAKAVAGGDG
jgi:hypothetical protein